MLVIFSTCISNDFVETKSCWEIVILASLAVRSVKIETETDANLKNVTLAS